MFLIRFRTWIKIQFRVLRTRNYYPSTRLMAHKASTEVLHFSLLVAAVLASSHDCQLRLFFPFPLSVSVFGLPLFLFPPGALVEVKSEPVY